MVRLAGVGAVVSVTRRAAVGAEQAVHGARDIARVWPGLVDQTAALLGRVSALFDLAETVLADLPGLMAHAETVLDDAHQLLVHADASLGRAEPLLGDAERLLGQGELVLDRVHALIGRVEPLLKEAPGAVEAVTPLLDALGRVEPETLDRLADLFGRLSVAAPDELLDRLPELLQAVAEALDADSAGHLSKLVRLLPGFVDEVDEVVLPAYHLITELAPDLRVLRDVSERLEPMAIDLQARIAGLPGAARAKKRGLKDPQIREVVTTYETQDHSDQVHDASNVAREHEG
jgi:ABC-type transporter Mla subunit MlaD